MEMKDEALTKEKIKINENMDENKKLNISQNKKSFNLQDKPTITDNGEKKNETIKGESKNSCLRCLNCLSIPLLLLNNSTHTVKINCNQGHNFSMDIKDYLQKGYINNFYNQICSQCKTRIDVLTERKNYFCKECNEIFCRTCIKSHNLIFNNNNQNSVHHFINLEKYDTTCVYHNETYGFFCEDCNLNICTYCYKNKHRNHNIFDLDDINLKRKQIKKIKDNFNIEKENLNLASSSIKKIILKIKREIKKILEFKEEELKFKEDIIKIYENKIDNFIIIKNVKNLLFNTSSFIIDSKTSNLEQLNYFYDYINKDLEKLKMMQAKESNSSIISKITNKNVSDNETKNISKLLSNKTINNIKSDEEMSKKSKNNSKNKVKSHDKTKKKIIIKKSDEKNKHLRNEKKRNTVQVTNIDLLIKDNFKKLIIDKEDNTKKENNTNDNISIKKEKKNSLLNNNNSDNEKLYSHKSIKLNKNINIKNDKLNESKKETSEDKVIQKKPKVKKIVKKKIKKKAMKKEIDIDESEYITEGNNIKLNIKNNIKSHNSESNLNKKFNFEKGEETKIKESNNNKSKAENILYKKINMHNIKDKILIKNESKIINKKINKEDKKEKEKEESKIHKDSQKNKEIKMHKNSKENSKISQEKNIMINNELKEIKNLKENKDIKNNDEHKEIMENNNNSNTKENDIKDLIMKRLKIPKPENRNNLDILDSYRHKKIFNKNNQKNISFNFQINHSVVEFYSYGGNLNESIKDNKKRVQILYKVPSFELKKPKILNNSFSGINNNIFSVLSNEQFKNINIGDQKISKDLVKEFKNDNSKSTNNNIISENKDENINKSEETKDNNVMVEKKENKNKNLEKEINKLNKVINNINIDNKLTNKDSDEFKLLNSNENTPIIDTELYLSDGKTVNEFKLKSLRLTIKEYENSVYSILGINQTIFAVGFLNGEIDIYDTSDIICLFSITEHTSRINNMCLSKEPKTILSSSFDYTMKKIKIIEEKKTYIVEFIFNGYEGIIYKGIELSNDNILSISFGGEISIWKKMTNKAYIRNESKIIEDEELYDIIEINNKLIAVSTDESLHFFIINNNKNEYLIHNKKISDLEFKQRNNMVLLNSNILGILLKNEIGLVDIIHKQIISKCNIYEGKPETITLMKDKTVLISTCNYNFKDYDEETEEKFGKNDLIRNNNKILFLQYELVNNGLMFLLKKEECSDKINSKDYCRVTSVSEFPNGTIVFSTSGMEDKKICGTISAFDY